jgi:PBP1b-binding outer membrane lipoprotein LpoB
MGMAIVSTMSLSVLFIISCASPEPQKTVDQNADSTRKALDAQERGDTAP